MLINGLASSLCKTIEDCCDNFLRVIYYFLIEIFFYELSRFKTLSLFNESSSRSFFWLLELLLDIIEGLLGFFGLFDPDNMETEVIAFIKIVACFFSLFFFY